MSTGPKTPPKRNRATPLDLEPRRKFHSQKEPASGHQYDEQIDLSDKGKEADDFTRRWKRIGSDMIRGLQIGRKIAMLVAGKNWPKGKGYIHRLGIGRSKHVRDPMITALLWLGDEAGCHYLTGARPIERFPRARHGGIARAISDGLRQRSKALGKHAD